VHAVTQHVIPTLAVDERSTRNRLHQRHIGADRWRPHDAVRHEVLGGDRTDEIKLVMDFYTVPFRQPQMAYDKFLPVALLCFRAVREYSRDRQRLGQSVPPCYMCCDGEKDRRVPPTGERNAAWRMNQGLAYHILKYSPRVVDRSRRRRRSTVLSEHGPEEDLHRSHHIERLLRHICSVGGPSDERIADRMVMMQLRQDRLTWHVAGDDVVVLDLKGSVYLKLNGSGRTLWERLAEGCDHTDLVSALVAEYGIDNDRATDDVDRFLADLRGRGLLA
jgi:hypothetical protein